MAPDKEGQTSSRLTAVQALEQGIAHHRENRFHDAEKLYRSVLETDPDQPDAHYNLGILALQLGRPIAALPYFKAALASGGEREQYWLSYVNTLARSGQTGAAREEIERARQRGFDSVKLGALEVELAAAEGGEPSEREIGLAQEMVAKGLYKEAESLCRELLQRFRPYGMVCPS